MGRLLDGKWMTQDLGSDAQGSYVRRATQFRRTDVTATPDEIGRYVLIVAWACGWSHRVLLVRAVLGLEEAIPILVCDPFMGEQGWTFPGGGISGDALYQDPSKQQQAMHVKAMYELYTLAQSDYTGRASVPVLWDTKTGRIVNNESSDIVKILLDQFAGPLGQAIYPPDLVPIDKNEAIQEMVQSNYGPINNGVYRCGFASSQTAYEEAATALFARLDELEDRLGAQRYLLGDQLTLADLCLFPTLVRFDHVYYTHFKCNRKHVYEYPNLWGWTRDMYQLQGVSKTCRFDAIREHYYTSHESIHPRRYIPLGPKLDFDTPHGRDTQDYGS